MERYTPEFLAAARHGYENTDQPMTALAADLGIGITTLPSLVRKHGWTQRSQRMRAGGGESNSVPYDDMPEDMDAFREALAQRIDTFVESRMGKEWMDAERERAREHLEAMEAKREEL
jgi:hypothetical protein